MIRRPPRSTRVRSSAASDVYKRQVMALVMALALVLTIQIEGNLLNPFILGKAVQIHPLGILMAVTAGTILGGIFGAFIAVPLVAILNNVVNDVHNRDMG